MLQKVVGERHRDTALAHANIANRLVNLERFNEAVPHYESALAAYRAVGIEDANVVRAMAGLGDTHLERHDVAAAVAAFEEALALATRVLGRDHQVYATTLASLGGAHLSAHRARLAVTELEEAESVLLRAMPFT